MVLTQTQYWMTKKEALNRYRVPIRHLDRAVAEGIIRTIKWGEKRQSARQYRISDVESWLNALSQGRTMPRTRRHKRPI